MSEALRTYIAIDLKSFYASVECVERGLDPLTAKLVVADESRTDKTICLAVTPALKSLGISGRARLWEVRQKASHTEYIVTPPRMRLYMDYSNKVMDVYLKYVAPEDIHRYSVDEVFIDITSYLWLYKYNAHEITRQIIRDVLQTTGITATAGIGTNLYLAKVAMDIVAKRMPADENGVRIAELTENSYRKLLWNHHPITDFWRIGKRTAEKLAKYGIHTMGQLARFSLSSELLLFKQFGVNAELLIDHAWGWEPCRMSDIKNYSPKSSSLASGQVLNYPYTTPNARIVVHEMAQALALDLLSQKLFAQRIVLTIGYDQDSLYNIEKRNLYTGNITTDYYGRKVPERAYGSYNLPYPTSSEHTIIQAAINLYDDIVNNNLLVRRINITAANIINPAKAQTTKKDEGIQLDLFDDLKNSSNAESEATEPYNKEKRLMQTSLEIHKRYGKNALLKGINFDGASTGRERNEQIGGHHK